MENTDTTTTELTTTDTTAIELPAALGALCEELKALAARIPDTNEGRVVLSQIQVACERVCCAESAARDLGIF